MMIGTKQRCNNLPDTNLNVKLNNVTVECVNEAKCLGVTLDSHLTFNSHVNSIAKIVKQKIGVLRRLRNHFSSRQLSSLYWGMSSPIFSIVLMYGPGGVNRIMTHWTNCTKGQHTWCLRKHGLHHPVKFWTNFHGHR